MQKHVFALAGLIALTGCMRVETPEQADVIARSMLTPERVAGGEKLSSPGLEGDFWVIKGSQNPDGCGFSDDFWIPRSGAKPVHMSRMTICDLPRMPYHR